jgi:hypothetical protein
MEHSFEWLLAAFAAPKKRHSYGTQNMGGLTWTNPTIPRGT